MHECKIAPLHRRPVRRSPWPARAVAQFGVGLSVCAFGIAGCTHAQAKAVPDAPLEMPAPPPRTVEAVDVEPPQPVSLPEEPAHRPPAWRQPPPRVEPKADVKPVEPPKPEVVLPPEPPKPVEEPPKPPTLQMTPAANEAELERSIRTTLTRAHTDLKRVDFGKLNADARTQYDFANRYIQQAEDALGKKNLVFAEAFAKKAADIAVQLAGK
jgi:outer membrane biosynthesis protein TonB